MHERPAVLWTILAHLFLCNMETMAVPEGTMNRLAGPVAAWGRAGSLKFPKHFHWCFCEGFSVCRGFPRCTASDLCLHYLQMGLGGGWVAACC